MIRRERIWAVAQRHICLNLMFISALLLLSSCDSNKGKVKELAKQFVIAYNEGDKASVYDLFPAIKTYDNLSMSGTIGQGDMSVEKEDSTGYYIVTIDQEKQQRLVFAVYDVGMIHIVDTYGVFHLDSLAVELALKTGVPIKKLSDVTKSKLFDEDGPYISYLKTSYSKELNGNLVCVSKSFEIYAFRQIIRNTGNVAVSGHDYNIEFNFYSPRGSVNRKQLIEPGVDLLPNEAATIETDPGYTYYYAYYYDNDLTCAVSFVYNNRPPIETMLKYVKFKGNEYDEYMKNKDSWDTKDKADPQNPYAWLSERLATEQDLEGKSDFDLRIMRNTIFAMHGYIFKSSDLQEYFGKLSWYKPEKADVTSELSAIETKNIEFIKSHE